MHTYEVAPHLSEFQVSLSTFLSTKPDCLYAVVGAYIFSECRAAPLTDSSIISTVDSRDNSLELRVLLLERSLSDSYGGWWEGPSGTCEMSDTTILDSLVREVYEESGLHVSRIFDYVATETWDEPSEDAGNVESNSEDKVTKDKAVKVSFLVDVYESVATTTDGQPQPEGWEHRIKLAPDEHEQYQWGTESEVEDGALRQKGPFKFGGEEGTNFLKAFDLFRARIVQSKED